MWIFHGGRLQDRITPSLSCLSIHTSRNVAAPSADRRSVVLCLFVSLVPNLHSVPHLLKQYCIIFQYYAHLQDHNFIFGLWRYIYII